MGGETDNIYFLHNPRKRVQAGQLPHAEQYYRELTMHSQTPLISVIIPARNEEQHLPCCIASIRASAARLSKPVEIIVVINRCTDRTEEVALVLGCVTTHNDSKNLSQIRNAGARLARGEFVVTIDADSTMSRNMLTAVAENLSCSDIVGGGVLFVTERLSLGILLTGLCLLPLLAYGLLSVGLFYCRKKDFNAIGGFDEKLVSLEDVDFARRLKMHGKKTGRKFKTICRAYICTSCRKFDQFGDWYFLRHPGFFRSLLSGSNREAANKFWYDIER